MVSRKYFCNLFLNINLEVEILTSLGSSFHGLAPGYQIESNPSREYFCRSDKDHYSMTVSLHGYVLWSSNKVKEFKFENI